MPVGSQGGTVGLRRTPYVGPYNRAPVRLTLDHRTPYYYPLYFASSGLPPSCSLSLLYVPFALFSPVVSLLARPSVLTLLPSLVGLLLDVLELGVLDCCLACCSPSGRRPAAPPGWSPHDGVAPYAGAAPACGSACQSPASGRCRSAGLPRAGVSKLFVCMRTLLIIYHVLGESAGAGELEFTCRGIVGEP